MDCATVVNSLRQRVWSSFEGRWYNPISLRLCTEGGSAIVMVSQNPQQAHFDRSINWPITLDGSLGPARRKLDQYEFSCRDKASVNAKLPLNPGNPYVETASQVIGRRNKGLTVTCKFEHHTVLGQFHRHKGTEGIWIFSDRSSQGPVATQQWNQFVSRFGIRVGSDEKTIPVYLDFHYDRLIVIRLRPSTGATPEGRT